MSIYSCAFATTQTAASSPMAEIYTAPAMSCRIVEVICCMVAATAASWYLGRSGAQGTGRANIFPFLQEQSSNDPTSQTNVCTSWTGVAPTSPAYWMRGMICPANISGTIRWVFPRGLYIPASSSVVIWRDTAVAAVINIIIDE